MDFSVVESMQDAQGGGGTRSARKLIIMLCRKHGVFSFTQGLNSEIVQQKSQWSSCVTHKGRAGLR